MRVNDVCTMSADAVQNYGEKWRNVELIVTHKATAYMPAKDFFAKGKPDGYHPGFDEGTGPLYDLKRKDTGEPLPMSLYGWELRAGGL